MTGGDGSVRALADASITGSVSIGGGAHGVALTVADVTDPAG